jgi:hypothetical protein
MDKEQQMIAIHSTVEDYFRFNSNVTCSSPAQAKGFLSHFDHIRWEARAGN